MRPEVTSSRKIVSRRTALGFALAASAMLATPVRLAAQAAQTGKMLADDAHAAAKAGEIILIDIRTPEEWAETEIAEGAIALDMREKSFVQSLVDLRQANPQTPIAMICRTGNRSSYVIRALADQGFPGLVDVSEGMAGGRNGKGWLKRGLPTYPGTKPEIDKRLQEVMP